MLTEIIAEHTEELLAKFSGDKRTKVMIALARLRENTARLGTRHDEYQDIELKLMAGAAENFRGQVLRFTASVSR